MRAEVGDTRAAVRPFLQAGSRKKPGNYFPANVHAVSWIQTVKLLHTYFTCRREESTCPFFSFFFLFFCSIFRELRFFGKIGPP